MQLADLDLIRSNFYFNLAEKSGRLRYAEVLHNRGDYQNKVVNYLLKGTYMSPHLHPGDEKVEVITVLSGILKIFYFNDQGAIVSSKVLDSSSANLTDRSVAVPAFTWHTYVTLTDKVITYETMDGIYDPLTWKKLASWAPKENESGYLEYLRKLS